MNCLLQVARGPRFGKMFRANSTAFLLEVARTATPVGGSSQVLRKSRTVISANRTFTMPEGSVVTQLTGMAAGLDATVFPDPGKFDSSRPNLGEAMNWNGLNKYVFTRNYAKAPRFCPGAMLSVKIAAKVCHHFSAHLSPA